MTTETEPDLLPRDKLLRDTFTPAETLLFATILATSCVSFLLVDPRSYWLLGFFLIIGGLTPVILKTHQDTHPFFVDFLWRKFWLYSSPVWLVVTVFAIGLLQDPLYQLDFHGESFLALREVHPWLPVSTAGSKTWPAVFGFCAIYCAAVNLFLVPKSRSFFERLMPWLCSAAVLVAVFGYLQTALQLDAPLFTKGTGRSDFFSFFPYDGHWAAFATLWTCTCIGMALLTTRYDDSPRFIDSSGPWYLTGGIFLGGSAFLVEARWPAAVLLLSTSIMLMIVAIELLSIKKDPHRKPISMLCGLFATSAFSAGLFRIFQPRPEANVEDSLRYAAFQMFSDRPIFGWGMDSFESIVPFYGSDLLVGQNYSRAHSDLLQFLAENGIAGLLTVAIVFSYLLIRYLRGRHDIKLSNHLFIGCGALLILGLCDTPFMSPAVFFSFLIIFFTGLRWADLSRNKVDEVDAPRPVLVTPESERRIPFFTNTSHKREK